MSPAVTVVIPAFNEEEHIAACLEAFTRQQTSIPFDIILVDNCSNDRTSEVAQTFASRLPLKIIHEGKKGRGAARARGFAEATGSIILSTDADTIVPPNWVTAFAGALMLRQDVVAVTGRPMLTEFSWWKNAVFNTIVPLCIVINGFFFRNVGLSGFSFAVRKSAYDQAGGFDAEADAYEDLDLANRVRKIGKIVYLAHPAVIFSGRRFKHGLIRGLFEYWHTFFHKFILRKRRVILSDVK
ncbi:glycosyltransferase [Candidatus Peribacteria bacterium]|nr:glycosyltransferase [Candidatus Peribacteria bacterium]